MAARRLLVLTLRLNFPSTFDCLTATEALDRAAHLTPKEV